MSDLNRIAVFAEVVAAGSFSAGAKTLGIPKSSASRSVRQLEDALSVRLLERTTRRLRLTDAGREYYERVSAALSGLDEARATVTEMQETPKGMVRLAAPSAFGAMMLAPVIARFIAQYPGIFIDVSLVDRDVDLVRDGFDLALKVGRLDDSSLIARTIGSIDRALFAAPEYLERRGTPKKLSDLADHDVLVCRTMDLTSNRLRLRGPNGRMESVAVRGPIGTDAVMLVHEGLRLGLGIGLLPLAGKAFMPLTHVLPDYIEPGLKFSLVYPSSRFMPQRVALLRDALVSELQAAFKHPEEACKKAAHAKGGC